MKTARLLGRHDIKTYRDVANQTPEQLTKTLQESGPMFASNDPASWPEQAKLAMDGKWNDIDRLYGSNGAPISDSGNSGVAASTVSTASAPSASTGGAVRDDLTRIVGVGPKASQLLRREGINSFSELAAIDQARLRTILADGGSRFALLDPQSWPEQAALAANGQWDSLSQMQESLATSTRSAEPATVSASAATSKGATSGGPDKLTRVEGIGPKIAELLNAAGINTFDELAVAQQDNLKSILEKGGSRFSLADPGTWPEQARLAANGSWTELEKLQDSLDGGKRT